MGRRALPKLDPTLDLRSVLLAMDQLPRPWNQAALFGRSAPLEVEIGSGKGLFLAAAAAADPAIDFLGSEIAAKYAAHAAARAVKRGLANVRVLHGDAARLLSEYLPAACCTAVHVYFPDPWWKKRHHKRRMMREPVVRDIERVLVAGGRLNFWTDVEEYFQLTLGLIRQVTRLVGPQPVVERAAEHDLDYRTHFERRMRLHGLPVYRSEFVKSERPLRKAGDQEKIQMTEARLIVEGEVERPGALAAGDLAAIDARHKIVDVSQIDPKRQGAAVWLRGLLEHVGAKPTAGYLTLHASADDFHASIPLSSVLDRGFVIYSLGGKPLPASAGGPFRFFVRDYLACHSAEIDECANVKFVDRIELTAARGRDNRPHDDAAHAALHANG
jgi:tRNA (guanine-N7-)-methyltransferase